MAYRHFIQTTSMLLWLGGAATGIAAETPHAKAHPARDLSGLWQLRDDSKHVKPASLTAAAIATEKGDQAKVDAGQIVIPASRWCQPLGVPFIMGDSAPLDIAQSKFEVAIMAEVQSSARHIYIDGRSHPDMADYDATTDGHSIGHWDGDTLSVDTVGFNDRGNTMIPGGGHRGPASHLQEKYRLLEGGEALSITFTWTDPGVFTQPQTYDFVYHRAAPGAYSFEYFCDASDPARGRN
jgi:hypothetical protein